MFLASLFLAISPGDTGSAEAFREQLDGSQQEAFESIAQAYDEYIALHPDEATAAIERCLFLEEEGTCTQELIDRFPDHVDIVLMHADTLPRGEALALLAATLGRPDLQDTERALLYEKLAHFTDDEQKRLWYARVALSLDPSVSGKELVVADLIDSDRINEAVALMSASEDADFAPRLWEVGAVDRAVALDPDIKPPPPKVVAWYWLLAALVALLLAPAVYVVPAHYWSLWRRQRKSENDVNSRWRFRHVWYAHAFFLLGEMLALYWFAPETAKAWLTFANAPWMPPQAMGHYAIFGSVLSALLVLTLIRPADAPLLGAGVWRKRESFAAAVVGLIIVLAFAGLLVQLAVTTVEMRRFIQAITAVYGLGVAYLVVAVVAPIAEELIFRSVMLDAYARHMPFLVANALQAALFAAAHVDVSRAPQLFVLGFVAGVLRQRSGGLLASIMLHALNNFMAVSFTLAAPTPINVDRQALAQCIDGEERDYLERAIANRFVLNNAAWKIAIEKASTLECLRLAELAIDDALQDTVNDGFVDTKATVLYRRGRLHEAVDLQRALPDSPLSYSQLDRYIGGALLIYGEAPGVRLEGDKLLLPEPLPRGATVFVRTHGGLIRVLVPPGHDSVYQLSAPTQIALIDARGCGGCGTYSSNFELHDPQVDKLP